MAYSSGQASSYSDLLSIIATSAQQNGWSWNASVLSKGQIGVRLNVVNEHLTALAGVGPSLLNQAPDIVRMGALDGKTTTFPALYHLFIFNDPDEIYCIIKSDIETYLWLCIGMSSMASLPGSGVWIAANKSAQASWSIHIESENGGYGYSGNPTPAAPFWNSGRCFNSFINHGFDSIEWNTKVEGRNTVGNALAVDFAAPLLTRLPNKWNSESVFVPITPIITRQSNKKSIATTILNARYLRIDNYQPEQIVTMGPDRWMIFPFYKKNSVLRDGGVGEHSGTFGWAIRYDGP